MAEAIDYEQFEATADGVGSGAGAAADLSRLSDIPMQLSVEIGRTHMTVGQALDLGVGAVVALERRAGDPVELLVNGTAIARGEVVVVEEQYGLRITEILDAGARGAPGAPDGDAEEDAAVQQLAGAADEAS